jgi:hypothetical protein
MALIFGIVGILRDQRKLVAVVTTLVAGAFVLLFVVGR